MPKLKPAAAVNERDRHCACIEELPNEVRVLRDAVDELRSELQWIANNREAVGEWANGYFVVKQIAADPCAKDWAERLMIERGEDAETAFAESAPAVADEVGDSMQQAKDDPAAVIPRGDVRAQSRLF